MKKITIGKTVDIWEDVASTILTHGITSIDFINREEIWLLSGDWSIVLHKDGTWSRT